MLTIIKNILGKHVKLHADNIYFESGSNTKGSWVKLPDGTMLVNYQGTSRTLGSTLYHGNYRAFFNGTFPTEFIKPPKVIMTGIVSESGIVRVANFFPESTSTNGYSIIILATQSFATLSNPEIFAIGRWK